MSQHKNLAEKEAFKWGEQIGVGKNNQDFKFYESFTYDGVEYFVYDCVYLYTADDPEPPIGKIVRIYETPKGGKKVKVVWFFRPPEVRNFLGGYEPKWNEIFLGSGSGVGLTNFNLLESIAQKCNVVCTSKDKRNPQPSEEELRLADYSFCCTFDVGEQKLSDKFPDAIDGIKVENFFNKKKVRKPSHQLSGNSGTKNLTGKSCSSTGTKGHMVKEQKPVSNVPIVEESVVSKLVQEDHLNERTTVKSQSSSQGEGSGNHTPLSEGANSSGKRGKFCVDSQNPNASKHYRKRKLLLDEEEHEVQKIIEHRPGENLDSKTDDTQHIVDKSKWFRKLPWEKRVEIANEEDTLVLLYVDPSFTSSEVEGLVWQALNEKVDAKMIQQNSYSSRHYGQALVIFKSKEAAASALDKLRKRCLMLADGRPIVGSQGKPPFPGKLSTFVGHLDLDIIHAGKPRKSELMKKAVSTAHVAQTNSAENELALKWLMLQEQSDMCWIELHRNQKEEIEALKSKLKLTWAK